MTGRLEKRLREVWQRGQTLNAASGLLVFCTWALVVFLLGMALDWLFQLPGVLRGCVLAVLVFLASRKAWGLAWRKLHAHDPVRTALRVEESAGGLESLLVSAVQLGQTGSSHGASPALCEETVRLADEAAASMRSQELVSFSGLRPLALVLLVPAGIVAVLALANGPLLATGFLRIFAPWSTATYPTRTTIEVAEGHRIVKEGEGVRLQARLSGEVPGGARIVLRTGKGTPRRRELVVEDSICAYEAEAVFRSFDYQISAGDASSDWYTVRVISSPRIERAEVELEYPAYTARPAETSEALTLTVPEGTGLRWTLMLDRAVSEAELRPVGGTAVPLEVGEDGLAIEFSQMANESRAYSFGWVDREHGFAFTSPRYYLQVAPDRPPGVELTSPEGTLYATLGRPLEFAFRARDDHGIGELAMAYRVGKTEQVRVELPIPEGSDGQEHGIDWDYRTALLDLEIGDTVSFALEVADLYPGEEGPNRARSDTRRVQFLSVEDYLAQIERQRRRLLGRIRAIYREERGVHELVRNLDPTDASFVQTCQLEAVRQDLIGERIGRLRAQIEVLVDDVEANGLSLESEGAPLVLLAEELTRIREEQIAAAASRLRELASMEPSPGSSPEPFRAVDAVNLAARELGLVVFQLGFAEASDVMARELHASAQTQASLRLLAVTGPGASRGAELARRQVRLADETARLLAATPRNKESNERDALIAFRLSRLTNGLQRARTDGRMREAAELASEGELAEAARIQAEVIASLLRAEFRLRQGAELEALTRAREFFDGQVAELGRLRRELESSTEQAFSDGRAARAAAQADLQRRLQLLLMPEVPAGRLGLFDRLAPEPPPVTELLARAESALEAGGSDLGDPVALAAHHGAAEEAFAALAGIVGERLKAVTLEERIRSTVAALGKQTIQQAMLEERLLILLEEIEDALDEGEPTASLAPLGRALTEDVTGLRERVVLWNQSLGASADDARALLEGLARAERGLADATGLLTGGEEDAEAALEYLEEALDALEESNLVIEQRTQMETALADALTATTAALAPSPLLTEIISEQSLLTETSEAAQPEDYGKLVIPQRNLIHAVNAVLTSLDPLAHEIESGTVMLFAREDMDAAAFGLEANDIEETLDAQAFVVESLLELQEKIDAFTPEYRYVFELTEYLHALNSRSENLQVRAREIGGEDTSELLELARGFGQGAARLTGGSRFQDTAESLALALGAPGTSDEVEAALQSLARDTADLRTIAENLAYLITPPPVSSYVAEPTPEVALIQDAIAVAAHQVDLIRLSHAEASMPLADISTRQGELASQAEALVRRTEPAHPWLEATGDRMAGAMSQLAAGEREAALSLQEEASDALRFFLLEYVLAHVQVPPPPPPEDPAPSDSVPEDGDLQLFLPGALTGTRPKGGRLEWEVLGRRDRAALNENFARELPLEYRALLKDYYERLTR